jgi:hypothetical protein
MSQCWELLCRDNGGHLMTTANLSELCPDMLGRNNGGLLMILSANSSFNVLRFSMFVTTKAPS